MLFTQVEFLFFFLPVTVAGYFLIAHLIEASTVRLSWLAVASLVFYGYWDYRFVPIILTSIVFNYTMGLLIARQSNRKSRAWVFAAAVAVNLFALSYFKYTNFAIQIFDLIARTHTSLLPIILPLGISFFTFTQIAYLADVYGGHQSERSFAKYALFVTYFAHLIAGPILHHREMMPQFGSKANRAISAQNVAIGLTILCIGLFKKSFIADGFALIANPVFQAASQAHLHVLDAWAGAFAYSLQIYFDFSGYSDMAIGLSLMFGIKLPFNFDAPYKSQSIVEFWRRWHISLSRFLRDYLYIPLGGNRHGGHRRNVNLAITMILGGLWHGAGITFVIWGALHGAFLIVNHQWSRLSREHPALTRVKKLWCYPLVALGLTQLAVVLAWIFFRADGFSTAVHVLQGMTGFADQSKVGTRLVDTYGGVAIALGYLACFVLPNVNAMFARWNVGLETYKNERPWSALHLTWRPSPVWAIAASLALVAAVVINLMAGDSSQFLYFQF
jgi:D-alanyl-lipoteichoic acid acyltransferase DltB (MBOAT superfamily)